MSACAIAAALGTGCGDDEHKGTVSHGPTAAATGTAAPDKKVRLVYEPKSPVATMRVAEIARKRLAAFDADVKIGGGTVHVDVQEAKAAAAKKAMTGGRLDLWLAADDSLDVPEEHEGLEVKEEAIEGGEKTRRYLEAPADKRTALAKIAGSQAGEVLIGPSRTPKGPLRTFSVEPGKKIRGEYVKSARIEPHPEGPRLVVVFEGSGRNFVRWNSKQKAAFVLQVDGSVIGRVQPSEEVTDGALTFTLEGWPDAEAKKIAAAIDGVALSHLTALDSEKAL